MADKSTGKTAAVTQLAKWQADPHSAFAKGVRASIKNWQALRLALHYQHIRNAKQKVDNLIDDVLQAFKNYPSKENEEYNLSDFLKDRLSMDFYTEAADGSTNYLAKLFNVMYKDCVIKKDFSGLEILLKRYEEQSDRLDVQVLNNGDDDLDEEYSDPDFEEEDYDEDFEEDEDIESEIEALQAEIEELKLAAEQPEQATPGEEHKDSNPVDIDSLIERLNKLTAIRDARLRAEAEAEAAAKAAEEERLAKERAKQPDEDGWFTVPVKSKKGKR